MTMLQKVLIFFQPVRHDYFDGPNKIIFGSKSLAKFLNTSAKFFP